MTNEKKLLCLVGLPGSGKSTWAKEQREQAKHEAIKSLTTVDAHFPLVTVVNKDQIREELTAKGWTWSPKNERDVILCRDSQIRAAFERGCTLVISDDTNFGDHPESLHNLADSLGVEFELKRFDTNIKTCIERDKQRVGKARVGEEVIRKMANRYQVYDPQVHQPVEKADDLMPALICDLDGTLALPNDRNPYDASKCEQDLLNDPVRKVIEVFYRFMFYQIVYLSGRSEVYRPQTEAWMRKHAVPPGPLYMRAANDTRHDWMVKGELFNEHVRGKHRVVFVLDDRNQVVKYWRSIGLTCLQVAEGDF